MKRAVTKSGTKTTSKVEVQERVDTICYVVNGTKMFLNMIEIDFDELCEILDQDMDED